MYQIDTYIKNGEGNKPEAVYIIKTEDNRYVVCMKDAKKAKQVVELLEADANVEE